MHRRRRRSLLTFVALLIVVAIGASIAGVSSKQTASAPAAGSVD